MELPAGVGWTALMTAYARAQESRRPDPLLDDPWAQAVVARATETATAAAGLPRVGPATDDGSSPMWTQLGTYFVTRSPFYDAQVLAGTADGIDQVVLLAAGFDGRAQRLDLPAGTTVYEVDTGPVLDFKDAALADAPAPGPRGGRCASTCAGTGRPRCARPVSTPAVPPSGSPRGC